MGSGNGRNIFVHQDVLDRINVVFALDRSSIIGPVNRLTPNEKARILMEQRLEQLEADVQSKGLALNSSPKEWPLLDQVAKSYRQPPAKIKKGKKSQSGFTTEG